MACICGSYSISVGPRGRTLLTRAKPRGPGRLGLQSCLCHERKTSLPPSCLPQLARVPEIPVLGLCFLGSGKLGRREMISALSLLDEPWKEKSGGTRPRQGMKGDARSPEGWPLVGRGGWKSGSQTWDPRASPSPILFSCAALAPSEHPG